MKKRTFENEQDFINGATSIPIVKRVRQKKYRAISVSLTDDHIKKIDNLILLAAKQGIIKVTRSDLIKIAIDKLKKEDLLT
ncbi:hypothetical protein [Arsenophonus nasoniae]|uniref:Uncharacterized protein n=1 Tax=Arsenophonus nasoniae TaxID=638 RepID=A0AA95K7Q8_9GAMM|nr:hypothetical protein [Arsenophonus nasoniae]WGM03590.1 hypothetical protein QE210_18965 [Arsenophonus nasoniae]